MTKPRKPRKKDCWGCGGAGKFGGENPWAFTCPGCGGTGISPSHNPKDPDDKEEDDERPLPGV